MTVLSYNKIADRAAILLGISSAFREREWLQMNYIILSYDITSSCRNRLHKECEKYLKQIHESVFEGNISVRNMNRLKNFIMHNLDHKTDSVVIYYPNGFDGFIRESIGKTIIFDNLFI